MGAPVPVQNGDTSKSVNSNSKSESFVIKKGIGIDIDTKSKVKSGNSQAKVNSENKEMKLKREIGLLEAVGITIGCIIGSGIFIAPKGISTYVHSIGASLLIWVVCGLLSMLGAFCFAELGTTFPTAGGQYTYVFEAFGPVLAFLSLWAQNLMFVPIGNAVTGLVFAKYITQPFFATGCPIPDSAVQLLAAAAICLLSFMNCCDIKYINKFINTFMFLKLTAVALIIVGGIYALYDRGPGNFDDLWSETDYSARSILFAIFAGQFAYGGYQAMSTMMEELNDPYRNLPRAIFISLSLLTIIYLLANISYFTVLTPTEMILSDAVAVTFVDKLIGPWLIWIVPVFVSLSTFGFLSLHILTNSRHCFVGARHGHFPSVLSLITYSYHTPAAAIMFQSLLSLFFLYTADVFALINFSALANSFYSTASIAALIYLRWKKPELPRPYKIPLIIPLINFLIGVIFMILIIYIDPLDSAISTLICLSGLPVYYILVQRDHSPKTLKLSERITIIFQKALMLVKED